MAVFHITFDSSRVIRVRVRGRAVTYDVRVERGLLGRSGPLMRPFAKGNVVALVTDRTVARLYAARVERSLRSAGLEVDRAVIAPGESSKAFETVRALADRWAKNGIGKDALVVALGGGVVSDVAGFAAASYGRGVPWVAMPTTLLAQADAAIGGKVGVNLAAGKNLLGAFHHPRAVLADPDALATLPSRAFRSGLAEVVKMALIRRPRMLPRLRGLVGASMDDAIASLPPLVLECASAKAWYVEHDERDEGLRRELNFGHTVGHALEASEGYRAYQHGEAVAIGMAAALRMSVLHAGLDPADAQEAEALIARLGLPTRLRRRPGSLFWKALLRDKKRGRKGLRVVLCPAIGQAEVFDLTSFTSLRRVVESLVRRT
ncbi:MAG TPA: 3-dehydroquinate synthase [Candidatus Eisenbacteria bacterium]|nr:3-dehydroquinate synthase [Candidatus Eisenbacteria bacterium]